MDRGIVILGGDAGAKEAGHLPHFYTDVHLVTSSIKGLPVPAACVTSLGRDCFEKHTEEIGG